MEKILEIQNIVKIYPTGLIANKSVSFDVRKGTIHAIVGENGAGKTTLVKIIFGIESAQEGRIIYKGSPITVDNPHYAITLGIGMVHQHFMLAPDLTVAENLVLGVETKRWRIFLHNKKAEDFTKKASEEFGLHVPPPNKKIRDLPIGARQRIEILKALYRNAELLILDEPTAVLTPQETEALFAVLMNLKKNGQTIIFISHKLKEVKEIADRITIMRQGKVVATENNETLTEHQIAHLMVGKDINFERIPPPKSVGQPFLTVQNLCYTNEEEVNVLKNVNFEVRADEILGIAGVDGNGQTELVEILNGLRAATKGKIFAKQRDITGLMPRKIREMGIAHIPQDRMKNGAAADATIEDNIIIDRYYRANFSKNARLMKECISEYTNKLIKDFNILASSSKTTVSALSGGNIQKVVVARELSMSPEIIIAAHPTRGIDVGSEEKIHDLLRDARDSGKAILLVSADLDELLKLATRIIVIYNGKIVGRFDDVENITAKDLGPYMLGIKKEE